MKTAIIISKKDPASLNIKDCLLEKYPFKENNDVYTLEDINIYTIEEESIYSENIDKKIRADLFIFATKHESTSKINSLSVHVPGNWSKAELGGKDRELCVAPVSLIKEILLELEKSNIDYEKIQEVTHHGPFLQKPCLFIEIGSTLSEWTNKEAGEIIATTIMNVLQKPTKKYKIAVGLGGLHHSPIFKKVILRTDITIGHICPKYMLENLDIEMLKQAIEKNVEKVDLILLDWKGLGQYKQKVLDLVKETGLPYERTDKIND